MKTHSSTRTIGRLLRKRDLLAVGDGPFERLEVGEQMLKEECAQGDDAQQRMQLAPEKGRSPGRRAAAGRRGVTVGAAGC